MSTDPFVRRRISRTQNWLGNLTIDTAEPTFRIVQIGSAVAGNWVDKVGATTGWTYGFLDDTCIDMRHTLMAMTQLLLCQNSVSGYGDVPGSLSASGDSGSPVFVVLSPLRVENTPPPFVLGPMPTMTPVPTATPPPAPTLQATPTPFDLAASSIC